MIHFNNNDPSLEQQWRGIILFGRNSASYKFAFTKSLFSIAEQDNGMTQMGFLPTVHLPFEPHPNWLNEDGEVEFKVVISFDKEGNKNGSMIKQISNKKV